MLSLQTNDIACQEVVELVTDYFEGALSRRDRHRMRIHLRECPNCSAYLERIRFTIVLAGSIPLNELTPEVMEDLIELFRRWRFE